MLNNHSSRVTDKEVLYYYPRLHETNASWRVPCTSTRREGEGGCQGMHYNVDRIRMYVQQWMCTYVYSSTVFTVALALRG